jgi:hypothetical protein
MKGTGISRRSARSGASIPRLLLPAIGYYPAELLFVACIGVIHIIFEYESHYRETKHGLRAKIDLRWTLFMVISTGMVTKRSTSCALLPGHLVMMRICVLVKSGKATIGVLIKQNIPITANPAVIKKVNILWRREKEIMFFTSLSM